MKLVRQIRFSERFGTRLLPEGYAATRMLVTDKRYRLLMKRLGFLLYEKKLRHWAEITMERPLVVMRGKVPVGACSCMHRSNQPDHTGFLGHFGVLPAHRRKGIGVYLLESTLNRFQFNSISIVELITQTNRRPAVALYRKFGFRDKGASR